MAFSGTTGYLGLRGMTILTSIQYSACIGLFLGLPIKVPMMPFHIWLPLAHVEVPVAGSILLAGVLLIIGTYGLIHCNLLFNCVLWCWYEYAMPLLEWWDKDSGKVRGALLAIIHSNCNCLGLDEQVEEFYRVSAVGNKEHSPVRMGS